MYIKNSLWFLFLKQDNRQTFPNTRVAVLIVRVCGRLQINKFCLKIIPELDLYQYLGNRPPTLPLTQH